MINKGLEGLNNSNRDREDQFSELNKLIIIANQKISIELSGELCEKKL